MQDTRLRYAIKFVADMEKAVKFYHDVLGLEGKFESPGWSEFVTGDTTLELIRLPTRTRGERRIGFYRCRCGGFLPGHERQGCSVQHGFQEAGFRRVAGDSESAHCSVGPEAA
jgi:catechol 2,3-dioxygenase-like lactoylglutathione lyase family enzyme